MKVWNSFRLLERLVAAAAVLGDAAHWVENPGSAVDSGDQPPAAALGLDLGGRAGGGGAREWSSWRGVAWWAARHAHWLAGEGVLEGAETMRKP